MASLVPATAGADDGGKSDAEMSPSLEPLTDNLHTTQKPKGGGGGLRTSLLRDCAASLQFELHGLSAQERAETLRRLNPPDKQASKKTSSEGCITSADPPDADGVLYCNTGGAECLIKIGSATLRIAIAVANSCSVAAQMRIINTRCRYPFLANEKDGIVTVTAAIIVEKDDGETRRCGMKNTNRVGKRHGGDEYNLRVAFEQKGSQTAAAALHRIHMYKDLPPAVQTAAMMDASAIPAPPSKRKKSEKPKAGGAPQDGGCGTPVGCHVATAAVAAAVGGGGGGDASVGGSTSTLPTAFRAPTTIVTPAPVTPIPFSLEEVGGGGGGGGGSGLGSDAEAAALAAKAAVTPSHGFGIGFDSSRSPPPRTSESFVNGIDANMESFVGELDLEQGNGTSIAHSAAAPHAPEPCEEAVEQLRNEHGADMFRLGFADLRALTRGAQITVLTRIADLCSDPAHADDLACLRHVINRLQSHVKLRSLQCPLTPLRCRPYFLAALSAVPAASSLVTPARR